MISLGFLFALPLVCILYIFCVRRENNALIFNVAILFSIFNLILSLIVAYNFDYTNSNVVQFSVDKILMLKGFYLYSVGMDGTSLLFVLLTNLLVIFCFMSAKYSIQKRQKGFIVSFLFLHAFCIGLFITKSVIWFYIFFEAILIPMFFIIGIWGGKNRIYASYKFFIYTFFGSVFFLLGIIYLVLLLGETDIYKMALILQYIEMPLLTQKIIWLALFISLAIKIPMFPFHTWLPDAHVEAPTAGSVILAGILIKIGGYGMIKFLLPMLPEATLYFQKFVIYLSIVSVLYGSFVAINQQDIKKMIAYSSIAHMGFVTAGIFSLNQNGFTAGIFQMISHGLVSGGLFLCIGVLYERLHTREFANFGGIAKKMPNFAIALMILTMASAGLPTTSGFVGEFLTIIAVYQNSVYYSILIGLSVIFGALYMLYMYKKTMFGVSTNPEISTLQDLNKSENIYLFAISFLVILLGIYPTAIIKFLPIVF